MSFVAWFAFEMWCQGNCGPYNVRFTSPERFCGSLLKVTWSWWHEIYESAFLAYWQSRRSVTLLCFELLITLLAITFYQLDLKDKEKHLAFLKYSYFPSFLQLKYYSSQMDVVLIFLCFSVHSGCFHSTHVWQSDLHAFRHSYWRDKTHTHTHKSHNAHTKERKTNSARKQVDDQTGLAEALWCLYKDLVLEICFTCSALTVLPLHSECEGDRYFRSRSGSVAQTFSSFKKQFLGTA